MPFRVHTATNPGGPLHRPSKARIFVSMSYADRNWLVFLAGVLLAGLLLRFAR